MSDSFNTRSTLSAAGEDYDFFALSALPDQYDLQALPFTHRVLLENLLRHEDGENITREDIIALCEWDAEAEPTTEIAFTPARVILQDFTGVPAVVDLAAMRDAVEALGAPADKINPLSPVELVIDHSVQVDKSGNPDAMTANAEIEFQRNRERYAFLRWGQQAFSNFRVVPPSTGIVHQVNLEYLARVVFESESESGRMAYPDTVVGTDSHTTMINGIGVLGWGVGGIEAEAAMLGQPITMLIPQVVGFRLVGQLPEGATATDLVLRIVEMLRAKGVVGKFVEFFGSGLRHLPLADRATIANMAPEYGATCGIFPSDAEAIRYLQLSGRSEAEVELVETYARAQGMFHDTNTPEATYSDVMKLDMSEVVPAIAGPKRPQDRIPLKESKARYKADTEELSGGREHPATALVDSDGARFELTDGAVVIAAITSCTNTSNPAVLIAAGLLARNALARGLKVKPWVKTSLAPGSKVVTEYLQKADLLSSLEQLGFFTVGYGCTTCIGNSGPLAPAISRAITDQDLIVTSVLSGNRNFEGRVHALARMNYLASPPLVVAYALAGHMNIDLTSQPLGEDPAGAPVYLRDIWPDSSEVRAAVDANVTSDLFRKSYDDVFSGDSRWQAVQSPAGERFSWDDQSTYIQNPPFFTAMDAQPSAVSDITEARCLALLGDSITTDHISPAGAIAPDSPAGRYLLAQGVERVDFNSYGSRRGNHEVMMRGTFANIRLRNLLAPGTEGGWTRYQPDDEQMSIYDAAMKYQEQKQPLIILAGKEYGTGSSRDWAAKGTRLLGVKAVICESYERIHRSNLIGMGVLPLNYLEGQNAQTLGLTGRELFSITGLGDGQAKSVTVTAVGDSSITFEARVRLDTPKEIEYFRNGGILQYVLRQIAGVA